MDFLTDLATFLYAAIVNLITLLSGVVGVVIDILRRRYGWEVPNNWYVWIIVVCLMFGMFSAWRDERAEHLTSQGKLVAADRKIVELEKQGEIKVRALQPIQIAEEEKMAMAKELKEAGSFSTVILRLPDADAVSVADFLWILREAGWEVRGTVVVVEDEPMLGIFILVPDSGDRPAGAEILARVFKKHNVDFIIRPRQDQGPGSFTILFGSRP